MEWLQCDFTLTFAVCVHLPLISSYRLLGSPDHYIRTFAARGEEVCLSIELCTALQTHLTLMHAIPMPALLSSLSTARLSDYLIMPDLIIV